MTSDGQKRCHIGYWIQGTKSEFLAYFGPGIGPQDHHKPEKSSRRLLKLQFNYI